MGTIKINEKKCRIISRIKLKTKTKSWFTISPGKFGLNPKLGSILFFMFDSKCKFNGENHGILHFSSNVEYFSL